MGSRPGVAKTRIDYVSKTMDDNLWIKAKELFHEALAKPLDERDEFLQEACGEDHALHQQVRELIDSYESGFMNEPVLEKVVEAMSSNDRLDESSHFGRYRVVRLIGSGGMGEVYLAHDDELDRPVALKLLHRDVAEDKERLRRFIQEARAASALNHPNILTIYEIGTHEGARFIVSEYIDGDTLRDRMRAGITPSESVDITCQVATALQAAHAAGIVHRDIKPENIMLRRDGLVKILDFGLAKLTEADDLPLDPSAPLSRVHTTPGLVMGTVAYMSPEQARGLAVDARTDLWSLGVVLHEMLTGESPFKGDSATDLVTSILKHDGIPVDCETLPADLRPICSKALAKDQRSRYQSAQQFLQDLQGEKKRMEYAIQQPFVTAANTDELKTQLIRPQRTLSAEYIVTTVKRHKYATLSAVALIATAAFAVAVYKFNGATPSTNGERNFAAISENTTEKDLDISRLPSSGRIFKVAISHDGKFAAYTTGLSEDTAGLHVIELSAKRDVEVVPGRTADKRAKLDNISFTPDGSRVLYRYFGWDSEDIFSVPVTGGPSEKVPFAFRAASFSPDGKRIAFHRSLNDEQTKKWLGYDLVLADPDGGNQRVLLHNLEGSEDFLWLGVPQWSDDGKWIAAWDWKDRSRGRFYAINTQDGSRQVYSDQEFSDITGVIWTPDGNMIVAAKEIGAQRGAPAQLWLVTKTTARRITNDPHGYTELSGTPDGRVLMTTQQIARNDLWVMNGTDARTASQITHSGEVGGGFASLPDGGVLVVSRINQNQSFWRMNLDGSVRKQLRSDPGTNLNPRPTRDGRYILFSSAMNGRDYSVFRINSDGSAPTQLAYMASLIDVSSDGRWAYYHHLEGKQRIISKVPVEGGPSVVVAKLDRPSQRYAISHLDGRIAEVYASPTGETSGGLRIYSPDGKELQNIPLTTIGDGALIHWTPDGKSVAYVDTRDERSNIWTIHAGGKRPPKRLTNFTSPITQAFAFSLDGKKTFVTRPVRTSDALLIRSSNN